MIRLVLRDRKELLAVQRLLVLVRLTEQVCLDVPVLFFGVDLFLDRL